MYPHPLAGTDEGAGSLTVMDGAVGDDDGVGGQSVSSGEVVVANDLT